jgi:SAM-dependent methyltransferase
MAFTTADPYDRSIGRWARELAPRFVALSGVPALSSGPVLDVGCGTGALTAWLAQRFGATGVTGIDPSEPFADACRAHVPGADVRIGVAEALPFRDRTFAAALAQLVLAFLRDAPRAVAEMRRVVRPGGIVATCMFAQGGFAPNRAVLEAARRIDPTSPGDRGTGYRTTDALRELWTAAGLREIRTGELELELDYDGFEDFFVPFEHGVGPTGEWLLAQPPERRRAVREACREVLGDPRAGFSLRSRVVAVTGVVA